MVEMAFTGAQFPVAFPHGKLHCAWGRAGHRTLRSKPFGWRMSHWPALRTMGPGHLDYEMGHAASYALAAVLIGLPMIGLGASWMLDGNPAEMGSGLTIYSVAQMVAYSPLVSWLGLILGVPLVHTAIRKGFGGWAVALGIGGVAGAIVLSLSVWSFLSFPTVRIGLIGAGFGALFAGVYWLVMRLTAPALFRPRPLPAEAEIR